MLGYCERNNYTMSGTKDAEVFGGFTYARYLQTNEFQAWSVHFSAFVSTNISETQFE